MISHRPRSLIALVWLAAGPAAAAAPWDGAPFTADPSEMMAAARALPPVKDGTDIDVLLHEEEYTLDAELRAVVRRRLVYRLLTPQGARAWATSEAYWRPWQQDRPKIEARVITARGAIHSFDPETLSDQGAAAEDPEVFTDLRRVRGPLPAVDAGALVEEQTTVRDTSPFFSKGSVYRYVAGGEYPIRRAVLKVSAPTSVPLAYELRGVAPEISDSTSGGKRTLLFEVGPLDEPEAPEPYLPHDAAPQMISFSTGRSWRDVGGEFGRLVDAQLSGGEIRQLAQQAFGSARGRDNLVRVALAWMHKEIRYTGVELGDAALVPRSPAEVLTRKYGDCKDLATLLVGLLRTRGIAAQVALLRTSWDEVAPSLPGAGGFDHAIVYVPGAPPLWVDPTSAVTPVGELPVMDQGRLALVASPKTQKLVLTPEADAKVNRSLVVREIQLAESGPARLTETRTTWGSLASRYRAVKEESSAADIREWYRGFAKEAFGAKELDAFEYGAGDDLRGPFKMSLSVRDSTLASTTDQAMSMHLRVGGLMGSLPGALVESPDDSGEDAERAKEVKPRKHDFLLVEPYSAELRFRIVPPPGYVARAFQTEGDVRRMGPATLSRAFSADKEGAILATFKFDVGKSRYTPEEYEAFRKSFAEWGSEPQDEVGFDHEGRIHLAAGRVREALESYRKLAALHPKEALHEIHLARALLEVGFGEPARQHARKAVQLEPRSAEAHQTLGWILQHDVLGRRFRQGFDLDGAVAEYSKAKELDPSSFEIRGDLAILLEHDAEGERYGAGARLDEAVAEYRALRDMGHHELDDNILYALMWSHRYDELAKEASEGKDSADRSAFKVLAVAAGKGAKAAVAEAGRLGRTPDARRTLLSRAADWLVLLRLYPQAAELLAEAAKGASGQAPLQRRIALLAKTRRYDAAGQPNGARGVVAGAMAAVFDPNVRPETLSAFFAKETKAGSSDDAIGRALRGAIGSFRRRIAQSGATPAVAVDTTLSAMEAIVEGDDATGYRVRMTLPFGSGAFETWYLVREDGALKILATGRNPETLGVMALARARRGDLAGARKLLDWIRDRGPCGGGANGWSAFCAMWPENGGREGAEEISRAAAAAAALSDAPGEAVGLLERARQSASPELAKAIDWALAAAYLNGEKLADLDKVSARLYAAEGPTARALGLRLDVLRRLERTVELEALAQKRLVENPGDKVALGRLMAHKLREGDYAGGASLGEKLVASGAATADDYNELAWLSLFAGRVNDRTVELAQRATSMTESSVRAYLHTLASVDAELGKSAEAREILVKSLELRLEDAPDPADWYVIGRIAENYALADAARAAYQRTLATKVDPATPGSVELLAKRRLDALGPAQLAEPNPP